MRKLKDTKKITYRGSSREFSYGGYHSNGQPYPCVILEGKWIEERYGLKIGDTVGIQYGAKVITLEMKPMPKIVRETCEECGRRLRKQVSEGQTGIVEPKRICKNCADRLKEIRLKPLIMEAIGQRSLI
jgi:hypothetical protein